MTGRWSPPLQMRVGVDDALEPPPPLDPRPDERRRENPQLDPTMIDHGVDLEMLSTLPRPRGRMWTAASTWKGFGEHGKGKWEEGIEIVDGVVDEIDEAADRSADALGVEEVDQGVEEKLLGDLHPRRRR